MINVDSILQGGGLLAVALIIFAECGLLLGFFLPGDTLLIAAGVFAAQGKLPIALLLPIVAIAAIAGYQVGYLIGERAGPRVFKRKDGLLFREEYVDRAQDFFTRHGGKAILLARFIAVVRTFVPLVAGIGKMPQKKFVSYNVVGAILWTFSVTLAAFWVGSKIPNIDRYVVWLLVAAMVITSGSVFAQLLRSKKSRQQFKQSLREEFRYFIKGTK
jgi:membrane-associated protein